MERISNKQPRTQESGPDTILDSIDTRVPVPSGSMFVDPQKSLMLDSVEKQLQSVGFDISNGEARFKLGEAAMNAGGNTDFSIIDSEDPASFVILGKCSMESIQMSSMASYMDIKQKSMSVDYNSMISTLDSHDIHQKLTELLQENGRLKEVLKQNNTAMKHQISTLASWQEMIMKVHQNHKKKFAETTELIKYLKKENCELKMKLSMDQLENPETAFNTIGFNACEDMPENNSTFVEEVEKKDLPLEDDSPTSKEHPLLAIIDRLVELVSLEIKNGIKKLASERSDISESKLLIQQLLLLLLEAPEESAINEKCSLDEEQLRFAKECKSVEVKKKLISDEQGAKLLEALYGTSKLSERNENNELKMKLSMDQFENPEAAFQVVGANTRDERQESKKIVEESLSAVAHLPGVQSIPVIDPFPSFQILPGLQENQEQTSERTSISQHIQTIKSAIHERRLLDEEKLSFLKERESFEEEKKLFINQKKIFEEAQNDLNDTRDLLKRKMTSLDEEKTSLDQQSQLYESFVKTLQVEKKALETKCDNLMSELDIMKAILTRKDTEIKDLQRNLMQQIDVVYSLEVQMKMHEEDFMQERKIKDSLLLEYNKVVADLAYQMEFSKELRKKLGEHSSVPEPPAITSIACPKCNGTFRDSDSLVQHVQLCLDSM